MVKLLVNSLDHLSATAFYRTWGVFKYINSLEVTTDLKIDAFEMPRKVDWRTIQGTDIAYFERPFSSECFEKILKFKRLGVPIWIDYDDNLFCLQVDNPAFEFYPPKCHDIVKKCVELADVVTVSTDNLAKHYPSKNTRVIRNALPPEMLNNPLKKEQDDYIVWRGGMSHEGDIYAYWDQIKELTKKWQVLFLGATPNFIKYESKKNQNIKIIPPMSLDNYLATLFTLHPKCFIVPLDDNEFNKGKSNIAGLEALITGAMTVCPDWDEWKGSNFNSYTEHGLFETAAMTMATYRQHDIIKSRESQSEAYFNENMKRVGIIKHLMTM